MRSFHALLAAVCLFLFTSTAVAQPVIIVGDHTLKPDTAGQTIEIMVTGGDLVQGLNFNVQIADGGPDLAGAIDGPEFTQIDILNGTIFDGNNTGLGGGNQIFSGGQLGFFSTTTGAGTVPANGLLATLTVDTTGFNIGVGPFDLLLSGTLNGNTDFAGVGANITNGRILIDFVPIIWNGAGANNLASNGNNWVDGVAPVDGDDVIFTGATRTSPVIDDAVDLRTVEFDNGADPFTVGDAANFGLNIQPNGDLVNDSPNRQTINAMVNFLGDGEIDANTNSFFIESVDLPNGGTLTVDVGPGHPAFTTIGPISGVAADLVKNGDGIVELIDTNTFDGDATVNGGGLLLNGGGTVLPDGINVMLNNTAFLETRANETIDALQGGANTQVFLENNALTLGGANQPTAFDGSFASSPTGMLILNGAQPKTFTNPNSDFGGGTTLNGGPLIFGGSSPNGTGPIGGGPLNVNGGSLAAVNGDQILNNDVNINTPTLTFDGSDDLTINGATGLGNADRGIDIIDSAGTFTFSGTITGDPGVGITKSGDGTANLNGANTFTGDVNVTGGTLGVNGGSAIGNNAGVMLSSGTTFNVNGAEAVGTFDGAASSTINLNDGLSITDGTVSSTINGAGGIMITGTGTTTIDGNNTFGGGVDLGGTSTLIIGNNNALGAGGFNIGDGTTVQPNGGPIAIPNNTTVGGDFTIGGTNGLTFAGIDIGGTTRGITLNNTTPTEFGVTSGAGGITITGTGEVNLAQDNTYTGTTTIGGTANVRFDGSVDGGVFLNGGTGTFNNDNAIAPGQSLQITGGTIDSTTGARSLANPVTINNNGGFTFDGANDFDFSGQVTLSGGDAGIDILSGGGGTFTFSDVTGAGGINKTGGGILIIDSAAGNDYLGDTTISGGTIDARGGGAIPDSSGIILNSATGTFQITNSETVGGLDGPSGTVNLDDELVINGQAGVQQNEFGGAISGASGIDINIGDDTLTFSGTTSDFTGGIDLNSGTLGIGADGTSAPPLGPLGAGTLTINGGNLTAVGGNRAVPNDLNLPNGSTLTTTGANGITIEGTTSINDASQGIDIQSAAGTFTFADTVIDGTVGSGLNLTGPGTVNLNGNNTFTGQTDVNNGTLGIDNGNALPDDQRVLVGANGQFNVNGAETIGGLEGAGGVTLTNRLSISDGGNREFSGDIGGAEGIDIDGGNTGTFTFSGLGTYNGDTNLANGTTILTGSVTSTVNVNNNAILEGDGDINGGGNLNVNAGGEVGPGQSIGQMDVTGDFVLQPNGTFDAEVASANGTADLLNVTGTATLGAGSFIDVSLFGGGEVANGNTYIILTAAGGITDNGVDIDSDIPFVDFVAALINGNTQLQLTAQAIDAIEWTGGDADDNFTSGNNWDPADPLPNGTTDVGNKTLAFIAPGNFTPNANAGPYTNIGGILFNQASGTYNIVGDDLSFSADTTVENNSGNAQTINNNLNAGATGLEFDALSEDLNITGNVDVGATGIAVIGDNDTTLSGTLSGVGGLQKEEAGTATITGNNTFQGGTNHMGGTLLLGNDNALGTGGLQLNGGALQSDNDARNVANNMTFGGNLTINAGNDLQLSGTADLGGATRTVTVNNTTTTLSGALSNGGLTKSGAGRLDLTGANTYTGDTTVTAGTLGLFGGSSIDDGGLLNLSTAGAVVEVNNDESIGSLSGVAGTTVDLNDATLTIANGANTVFAGVITNINGNVIKNGAGSLELSGANTYIGFTTLNNGTLNLTGSVTSDVTVNGGTLILGNDNAINGANVLNINGGAIESDDNARNIGNDLNVGGDFMITNNANLELGGAVDLGAANRNMNVNNTTTFSGAIGGAGGGLTQTGVGQINLTGNSTFTGDTVVQSGTVNLTGSIDGNADLQGGTLILGNDNGIQAGSNLNISGGTLQSDNDARNVGNDLDVTGDFTIAGNNLQLGGTVELGGANRTITINNTDTEFSGPVSSLGGGIIKDGAGTLEISGNNTSTGTTTVNAGTLELTGGSAINDATQLSINAAGATAQLNNDETIGSLDGVAGSTMNVQGNTLTTGQDGTNATFAGNIINNGGGGLTKIGAGTQTLSGNNTYDGTTTIDAGTLAVANGSAIIDTGAVQVNGTSTLQLDNDETIGSLSGVAGSNVNLQGNTLTTGDANNTQLDGNMTGAGGLNKQGAGTFTLGGNNDFTGPTNINEGTVSLAGGSALGDATAVTLANTAGVNLDLQANETIGSLAGGGANGGNLDLNGNTLTFGDANNTSFDGVAVGAGGLTKQGAGTTTLTGANTHTTTTVNAGTLALAGGAAVPDTGAVQVNAGGTVQLDANETIGSLNGAAGSVFNLQGNNLTTGDGGNTDFGGAITGAGGLTKQGAGTFTLSGANTFTGDTSITNGTLGLTGGSAIADTANVGLDNAAATLQLNNDETIGSLDGVANSTVNLGANTLTTGDATDTIFNGAINGTGGLTKQGAGGFSLTGVNPFTGATNVNAGTFTLNGSVGGDVNVNGGVFDGAGNVGGNLNGAGGTIRVGNSIGTVTVAGNFTLGATSILQVEINKDAPPNADLLDVTGNADLANGSTINVTPIGAADLVEQDLYTIIDTNGGTVTDLGALFTGPALFTFGGEINGDLYQIRVLDVLNFVEATLNSVNPGIGVALETVAVAADGGNQAAQDLIDAIGDFDQDQLNAFVRSVNDGANVPNVSSDTVTDIVQAFSQVLSNYLAMRRSGLPVLALNDPTTIYGGRPHGTLLVASSGADPVVMSYALAALRSEGNGESAEATPVEQIVQPKDELSFFVRAYGIYSDQDSTSDRTGYQSTGAGFQIGVDRQIDEHWLVGLVAGYSNTDADINDGLGDNEVDSFRIGPFVSYDGGDWFVDASLTYGHHRHDAKRNTTIPSTTTADYDGHDLTFYIGGGKDYKKGDWTITPTASLQYTYFHRESYTESGLGALSFSDNDTHTLHSRLGAKFATPIVIGETDVIAEFLVGWEHEFLDDVDNVEAAFPGGGTFTVDTSGPEQDSVFFGVGATALLENNKTAYLRYEGTANGNGETHALSAGLRFDF